MKNPVWKMRGHYNRFVYEHAEKFAKDFLQSGPDHSTFIKQCEDLARECEAFVPLGELEGYPSVKDVLVLAFRMINYEIDMIEAKTFSQL